MKTQQFIPTEFISKKKHVELQLIESMTCPLCYCIVVDPRECYNCQKLYCWKHVEDWIKTKTTCPTCRAKPWKLKRKVHRVYMQLLESLEFDCPCGETIAYKSIPQHGFWEHIQKDKQIQLQKKAEEELRKEEELRALQANKKNPMPVNSTTTSEVRKISVVSVEQLSNEQEKIHIPQKKQGINAMSLIRSKLEVIFNHKEEEKEQEKAEQQHSPLVPIKEEKHVPLDVTRLYYFYFILKNGKTVFLDRISNKQINKNFRKGIIAFDLQIDSRHVLYFDLAAMKATDPIHNEVFDLLASQVKHGVWRYFQDKVWLVYPPNIAEKIEKAYQQYAQKAQPIQIEIDFEGSKCIVNFKNTNQTNLDTKVQKSVKRRDL